ncbi:MAG TPA: helix-turn-helix transcriptional regulator [Acidimicrobiales bacterium]|nr:helix-turn-helix transcriptional regulator [Acidimicrobiales bacterium]
MDAGLLLTEARRRSGLSRRQLARRGRTSASTLAAYESGASVPSVATLTRLLRAAGFDAQVSLQGTGSAEDAERGAAIEALLVFTDGLPRAERGSLGYPVFGCRRAGADR